MTPSFFAEIWQDIDDSGNNVQVSRTPIVFRLLSNHAVVVKETPARLGFAAD